MMSMRFAASKGGKAAYHAGAPMSANPYTPGCAYARLWTNAWVDAWLKGDPSAKFHVVDWGGYYAVVSYAADGKITVHANRFRSFATAQKSADARNAKAKAGK